MLRRALLLPFLVGTACSAQNPPAPDRSERGAAVRPVAADPLSGPQGPQPAGSNLPVPGDAPSDPAIRNVPATGGRANLRKTVPPFAVTTLGRFDQPFAMAFLPDGRLLVTEKSGKLKLRAVDGTVAEVGGVPAVAANGQGGLLDVAVAPDFATSGTVYLSYAEPRPNGGSSLALARAALEQVRLVDCPKAPCAPADGRMALAGVRVLWRAGSDGPGGQFGATIAFAPDGQSLFLSSGERQRFTPAQDPAQRLGKIVHLTLDGEAAVGPPMSGGGVREMIWSSGHRNPYGLAFDAYGRLWEVEMGPKGGDEFNLILPGRNYGWPVVSNGDNYSGVPIPDHPSRGDFEAPKLWWNPSISPGGMMIYSGAMFPQYRGSAFIAALSGESLIRVTLGDKPAAADQWNMGTRIRDVAQAPDGSIWLLEDGERGAEGKLLRLARR